jgi:hypothetical protein
MTYRGYWIICHCCLFPIRLPHLLKLSLCIEKKLSIPILLACPVCAHVEEYSGTELKAIAFRIPDPFGQKKAALYEVEVPCGIPRCNRKARIYAVAATSVSIAVLLELWKRWVVRARCNGHFLKPSRSWTWGVYGIFRHLPNSDRTHRHFSSLR